MWMAGGGIKGGQAIGATDELGYAAVENKAHVHDVHATILHLMGMDHKLLTYFHGGRNIRLTDVLCRGIQEALGCFAADMGFSRSGLSVTTNKADINT